MQTTTQTTADTVTRTTLSDLADGTTLNLTTVAQTVTNPDGSTTTTQTDTSADNTKLDETDTTVTPTAGGGRITSVTTSELNGGTFGVVDRQSTTISAAGATQTTTMVDLSADGTERSRSVVTSTVGSAARTVTVKGNGDGSVTQSESVVIDGASGTTTDTLENFNGDTTLRNEIVTTTSSGGLAKTIGVNSTGTVSGSEPVFDHITTDDTSTSASGSTETVTDYGAAQTNADIIDRTQTTVSADGLTTTVSEAFTKASLTASIPTWDQITTDLTAVNSDHTLTETITVKDGVGNVLQTMEKDTSANRLQVTTTTKLGATGLVEQDEKVTTAADGMQIDQVVNLDKNRDVNSATVTTTSADGLIKKVQTDAQGQSKAIFEANGLAFDRTTFDTTAIAADGTRTETINVNSGDGVNNSTLLSTTSTLTSANGLTVTTTENPYATTDFATQTVDATTLNADGSRTEEVKDYSFNGVLSGALIDRTRTTTSASGLSTTVLHDLDGDGVTDQSSTDLTTINADGSRTEVVTDYTGDTTGIVRDVTDDLFRYHCGRRRPEDVDHAAVERLGAFLPDRDDHAERQRRRYRYDADLRPPGRDARADDAGHDQRQRAGQDDRRRGQWRHLARFLHQR